jgi:hypothetical protein
MPIALAVLPRFNSKRTGRFLLTDIGPVNCVAVGSDLTDAQSNEIAAAQLAVDRQPRLALFLLVAFRRLRR